ncbi:hypothetical protein AMECASPLE_039600, partial [Ameca splendens]
GSPGSASASEGSPGSANSKPPGFMPGSKPEARLKSPSWIGKRRRPPDTSLHGFLWARCQHPALSAPASTSLSLVSTPSPTTTQDYVLQVLVACLNSVFVSSKEASFLPG